MNLKNKSALIIMSLLVVTFISIGTTHAVSSSPSSVTVNLPSPSIVNEHLLLTTNSTGNATISSNSSAIILSSSKVLLTSGQFYNFSFKVNATASAIYKININQSGNVIKIPVIVTVQSPSSSAYTINIQGNVAPYSQIVVSVTTSSGQLVQSGTLIVAYNNLTSSFSLSTNPFPTISFGNLYGFVKFEYYSSSGFLSADLIESSGVASSVTQPVALSCSGLSKSAIGNISSYSILPNQTINCILYDPTDYNIITGANLVAIQNGNVYFPNPQDLSTGILEIQPPSGGWSVGPLLLTMKSSQYSLTPTLFEVSKASNPSTIEYLNGTPITASKIDQLSFLFVPNGNQSVSVAYPDGNTEKIQTQSPITISSNATGVVKITAGSNIYSTSTYSISVSSIPLSVYANSTNVKAIYPFTTYQFYTYSGGSLYPYTGIMKIGTSTLDFSNGVASGMLTSGNTSIYAPSGYSATLAQSLLSLPISLSFYENGVPVRSTGLMTGKIYKITVSSTDGRALPVTYDINETGANNGTIGITDGQAFIIFKNPGVTTLVSNFAGLDPVKDEVSIGLSFGGLNEEQVILIAVVLIIVVAALLYFKSRKGYADIARLGALSNMETGGE